MGKGTDKGDKLKEPERDNVKEVQERGRKEIRKEAELQREE